MRQEHERRSCVVCRKEGAQRELLRFFVGSEGFEFDAGRRMQGRGAYLHAAAECFSRASERRLWLRALSGSTKTRSEGDMRSHTVTEAALQKALEGARTWVPDLAVTQPAGGEGNRGSRGLRNRPAVRASKRIRM